MGGADAAQPHLAVSFADASRHPEVGVRPAQVVDEVAVVVVRLDLDDVGGLRLERVGQGPDELAQYGRFREQQVEQRVAG